MIKKIWVSRCLLGEKVRYDGGDKREDLVIDSLLDKFEICGICPEVEAGFSIPREPVNLQGEVDAARFVGAQTGYDYTDKINQWISEKIKELSFLNPQGFILKSNSPSCGLRHGPQGKYAGLFVQALRQAFTDIPIIDELDFRVPEYRSNFLTQVEKYR